MKSDVGWKYTMGLYLPPGWKSWSPRQVSLSRVILWPWRYGASGEHSVQHRIRQKWDHEWLLYRHLGWGSGCLRQQCNSSVPASRQRRTSLTIFGHLESSAKLEPDACWIQIRFGTTTEVPKCWRRHYIWYCGDEQNLFLCLQCLMTFAGKSDGEDSHANSRRKDMKQGGRRPWFFLGIHCPGVQRGQLCILLIYALLI
jgi:hypothetical protein